MPRVDIFQPNISGDSALYGGDFFLQEQTTEAQMQSTTDQWKFVK